MSADSRTLPSEKAAAAFLSELDALCEKHGIVIDEGAQLYEMEDGDRDFVYVADEEGVLART
jgi:hypothetical protein